MNALKWVVASFILASSVAVAQEPVIVGLITKTETNPFIVKMRQGAQAKADDGLADVTAETPEQTNSPEVVCSQDTQGDQSKGQTAMENCLTANPDINLVYTINEPAAYGAHTANRNAA